MNDNSANRAVIGDFVELRFTDLASSQFVRGKVDTGATICSLHCEGHEIDEKSNQITFKCSVLSPNSITMPLSDRQAVKNADGTEYRPVVELSVKVDDTIIEKVKFNLNDRSAMDCPVLVGQNLIKAGKFLIDPSRVSEALTASRLDDVESEFDADSVIDSVVGSINGIDDTSDVEAVELPAEDGEFDMGEDSRQAALEDIFQILRGSSITFQELIEYASNQQTDE